MTQVAKFRLTNEIVLSQVGEDGKPIMSADQLAELQQKGLVNYDDPVAMYEMLGLINQLGHLKTLQFLTPGLTSMKSDILNSPLMSEARAREEKDISIMMEEDKVYVQTDPCPDCGNKNVSAYRKQTRSADEPMTVFLTCLNCGRKWKD